MNAPATHTLAELALGIFMAAVLLGLPVLIWRLAIVSPYRSTRQRLERIARDLPGFHVGDTRDETSTFLGRIGAWPIARGRRHELEVVLTMHTRQRYDRAFTTANIAHPDSTGPLGVANGYTYRYLHVLARVPVFLGNWFEPPDRRTVETSWMGTCVAWGPADDFERLFDAQVRAELEAFPGELMLLAFDGAGTLSICWYGLEENPHVFEQALALGARVIRHARETGVLR